ncbi:hypothetical protein ANCCAN_25768 [Ancylostoma caninum]|uniref:Uncharacterized protein n=1 Tax=Ancylostoma caninum TaxID=29170 RepID=A0A368FA54_ANCCA|nr:hypothetical protein ANCCAN_25768 [Ancylostoma caninum]
MSSRHGSSEDVAKVTEELSYCRTRLDAGVQENRRNRDIIQGLTEQVGAANVTLSLSASFVTLKTSVFCSFVTSSDISPIPSPYCHSAIRPVLCFSFTTPLVGVRASPLIFSQIVTFFFPVKLSCISYSNAVPSVQCTFFAVALKNPINRFSTSVNTSA